MTLSRLRNDHPRFVYQSYGIKRARGSLTITYSFLLEPDIRFTPTIIIPLKKGVGLRLVEPFVFNLGLIEAISYWKTACPGELVVEAGYLSPEQIAWWHDLFLNGLGEFFYVNNIDFTKSDFLTIKATGKKTSEAGWVGSTMGNLILVGGGKDSTVTLELLKEDKKNNTLLLNPTPAALLVSGVAGFQQPLIVKRTIDPSLLELNRGGYLNGHTPFSAYLGFLSLLVAQIYGFGGIIASNEESASVGSLVFHNKEINHQYSKGYGFEKRLRAYIVKYLTCDINYRSVLRPLNELQIAWIFSTLKNYHPLFKSCNVGRGTRWCGGCAKCAFTYMVLAPFFSPKNMVAVFGIDFFNLPSLRQHFIDLAGTGGHKPLDCVGTPEETKQAIGLIISMYTSNNTPLPPIIKELKEKLFIAIDNETALNSLKSHWNKNNFLSPDEASLLRDRLTSIGLYSSP